MENLQNISWKNMEYHINHRNPEYCGIWKITKNHGNPEYHRISRKITKTQNITISWKITEKIIEKHRNTIESHGKSWKSRNITEITESQNIMEYGKSRKITQITETQNITENHRISWKVTENHRISWKIMESQKSQKTRFSCN